MTENTEASAIMALHKQVLVETGWECSTDSPPALKRAADTFRAEVERVLKERGELRQRVQQAEKAARETIEDCKRRGVSLGRILANYGYTMLERDNEALRSLLKEARECLDVATARPISVPAVLALLARIDDALAK
jgi:hypothetical protein